MVGVKYQVVEDETNLAAVCQHLSKSPCIALDTEFARFNTYYQIPGLVQVSDGQSHYLIDPMTIKVWQPLIDLLTNPNVIKVVHASGEDLELFNHWLDVVPTPLFDTQVAAAFAGVGLSVGLQALVKTLLNEHIDKEETRSDWLQRPLTESQLLYATVDVLFLLQCKQQLAAMLIANNRMEWFLQDMASLGQKKSPVLTEQVYLKVKRAWQLDTIALRRLQVLAAWRETQAQKDNKPKGFLLKDDQLIKIAEQAPITLPLLSSIEGVYPSFIRKYGTTIVALLDDLPEIDSDKLLAPPTPISKQEQPMYKKLHAMVKQVAQAHNIDTQLLVRKAQLIEVYERTRHGLDYQSHPAWVGWRAQLLDKPIRQVLSEVKQFYAAR